MSAKWIDTRDVGYAMLTCPNGDVLAETWFSSAYGSFGWKVFARDQYLVAGGYASTWAYAKRDAEAEVARRCT